VRVFGFLSALAVSSLIIISCIPNFSLKQPTGKCKLQYDNLKDNYGLIDDKVKTMQQQMAELEKRITRCTAPFFEANP